MRIASWIPKAKNIESEYVILFAFPLQQWLHERASVSRYTYSACLVFIYEQIFKKSSDFVTDILNEFLMFYVSALPSILLHPYCFSVKL